MELILVSAWMDSCFGMNFCLFKNNKTGMKINEKHNNVRVAFVEKKLWPVK